jgi:uncharacterized membrane protein
MKFAILVLGIISAILWLLAATVRIPYGFDTDERRHRKEKRVGWLNALAAIFSAATAIASAFSNERTN